MISSQIRRLCVIRLGIARAFRLAPCLPDDPVMGFDHRIGNGTAPFQHTFPKWHAV